MGQQTLSDEVVARLLRVMGGVNHVFLGTPIDADNDRIVASVQIADGDQVIAAQPDVPRNVTATLTDADNSVTALVTIRGKDPQGRPVSETMEPDGAGGGKTLTGTKIFAQVDQVEVSDTAGSAVGDNLIVGVGDVIGLPNDINDEEEVLHAYLGGVKVTPDAIATGESTSGIDVNSATYDGTKIMHAIVQSAAQA